MKITTWRARRARCLSACLFVLCCATLASGFEPTLPPPPWYAAGNRELTLIEEYLIVRFQDAGGLSSVQPMDTPIQPMDPGVGSAPTFQSEEFEKLLQKYSSSGDRINGAQAKPIAPFDLGRLVQESPDMPTTTVRQRSGASADPFVRSYSMGQIYTAVNGVNWVSARPDLDTVLSKTNSASLETLNIIPGPYGLRYGPGFAFVELATLATPRYQDGPQAHNRMGWTYRANGGQIYGTDRFYGGGAEYGYAISYGKRTGSDYAAGDGLRVPSGYENQDLIGQLGFDLTEYSRLEFRYQYVDQNNNECAAQFYDIDSLLTHAWSLSWYGGQPDDFVRLEATGWYNNTSFGGNTFGADKRRPDFPVLQRVDSALEAQGYKNWTGVMSGDLVSTGARSGLILGDAEEIQLRAGVDCRVIGQNIVENYNLYAAVDPTKNDLSFMTNLPKGKLIDPGLYTEATLNPTTYWTAVMGARMDWALTSADAAAVRSNSAFGPDLDQSDTLGACYLRNILRLDPNWTTELAFGHSQITPDLFQRYSDGVFLGIIQSGFSRVIGNPDLPKERLTQVDWSVEAKYEQVRARGSVFYAWINDYVTYSANRISDPLGARMLFAENTDLATLGGFELRGEYDVVPLTTVFGTMRYVQGEDCGIGQPLPQIPPLEGLVGLRWQDNEAARPWGVETAVRMVASQDRVAVLRDRTPGSTGLVSLEDPTSGFMTVYVRGFIQATRNLNLVGGIDNLFNRNYLEHLNLRLPASGPYAQSPVLSPGITPYLGVEWTL